MTRTDPLSEKPMEGVVLDKSKSRLQVVVKDYPPNVSEGTWVLTLSSPQRAFLPWAGNPGCELITGGGGGGHTASGQGRQQGVARPHDRRAEQVHQQSQY
jgi:hypothetical protein